MSPRGPSPDTHVPPLQPLVDAKESGERCPPNAPAAGAPETLPPGLGAAPWTPEAVAPGLGLFSPLLQPGG